MGALLTALTPYQIYMPYADQLHYDWWTLGKIDSEDEAWEWPCWQWLERARQQKYLKGGAFQGKLRLEAEAEEKAKSTGRPVTHQSDEERERTPVEPKAVNADGMRAKRDAQIAEMVAKREARAAAARAAAEEE